MGLASRSDCGDARSALQTATVALPSGQGHVRPVPCTLRRLKDSIKLTRRWRDYTDAHRNSEGHRRRAAP